MMVVSIASCKVNLFWLEDSKEVVVKEVAISGKRASSGGVVRDGMSKDVRVRA